VQDALASSFGELDAKGVDVATVYQSSSPLPPFRAGDDPTTVLHSRLKQWTKGQQPPRLPEPIVGIVLRADYTAAGTDMREAPGERESGMLERPGALLDEAMGLLKV